MARDVHLFVDEASFQYLALFRSRDEKHETSSGMTKRKEDKSGSWLWLMPQ